MGRTICHARRAVLSPPPDQSAVSFDRAAEFYDETRRLPSETAEELTELLVEEVAGQGACLEIGVGTGRISLPLCRRGVTVLGIDISPAMLRRLVDNAGGSAPFPVLLADATGIPAADGTVGRVLASHVLHLIPAWRDALDEIVRVLRPGGALLADFGGNPTAPWSADTESVLRRHGVVRVRPGAPGPEAVAEHLGLSARPLRPLRFVQRRTLAQDVDDWEGQIFSWTWPYSPEQVRTACSAVRRWARGAGWRLEEEVELERVIQWWAFDISAAASTTHCQTVGR